MGPAGDQGEDKPVPGQPRVRCRSRRLKSTTTHDATGYFTYFADQLAPRAPTRATPRRGGTASTSPSAAPSGTWWRSTPSAQRARASGRLGRRLRRGLRAGAVAPRGPGGEPQRLHDRLLAPSALQLRARTASSPIMAPIWNALYGTTPTSCSPGTTTTTSASPRPAHGRPRARARHPVVGGRHRGQEHGHPPPPPPRHRRPQQQHLRHSQADAARPGRRATPRLVPVGVRRRRTARIQHYSRTPAPATASAPALRRGQTRPRSARDTTRAADLLRAAEPAPVPPGLAAR